MKIRPAYLLCILTLFTQSAKSIAIWVWFCFAPLWSSRCLQCSKWDAMDRYFLPWHPRKYTATSFLGKSKIHYARYQTSNKHFGSSRISTWALGVPHFFKDYSLVQQRETDGRRRRSRRICCTLQQMWGCERRGCVREIPAGSDRIGSVVRVRSAFQNVNHFTVTRWSVVFLSHLAANLQFCDWEISEQTAAAVAGLCCKDIYYHPIRNWHLRTGRQAAGLMI